MREQEQSHAFQDGHLLTLRGLAYADGHLALPQGFKCPLSSKRASGKGVHHLSVGIDQRAVLGPGWPGRRGGSSGGLGGRFAEGVEEEDQDERDQANEGIEEETGGEDGELTETICPEKRTAVKEVIGLVSKWEPDLIGGHWSKAWPVPRLADGCKWPSPGRNPFYALSIGIVFHVETDLVHIQPDERPQKHNSHHQPPQAEPPSEP